MRVVETYSHLNGLEYLLVHKPGLWQEIRLPAPARIPSAGPI